MCVSVHAVRQGKQEGCLDRDRLRLLFDLALRRSSITALALDYVDLQARTVRVWSKGHSDEDYDTRSLPGPTAEAVQDWIDVRGDEPGALFVALATNSLG